MISRFASQATEDLFNGDDTKAARNALPKNLWAKASAVLDQLNTAAQPGDMKIPPSRRLEKLKGDRAGQWSVRINDQYRVCFRFEGSSALDVEVCDYH